MELCGGIHVKNTADVWYFKIVSKERLPEFVIEAITEMQQRLFFAPHEELNEIKTALKTRKIL
jgi:alanyl-tRNA synthetase